MCLDELRHIGERGCRSSWIYVAAHKFRQLKQFSVTLVAGMSIGVAE
jgi:hypothetical protein